MVLFDCRHPLPGRREAQGALGRQRRGDEVSITRERWTAAKFVQRQLRLARDRYKHLSHLEDPEVKEITRKDFMDLVRPALPRDAPRTNAMALVKAEKQRAKVSMPDWWRRAIARFTF